MRNLDAIPLIKKAGVCSEADKAYIDEHDGEYEDLVYEESVGRQESWSQGSMLGSPNVFRP